MSVSDFLLKRAEGKCELCFSETELNEYEVPPRNADKDEDKIVACKVCLTQIQDTEQLNVNHWRCLNESMWSQVPAVQVMTYRMLDQLNNEDWAVDLKNMLFLEDATLEWAQLGLNDEGPIVHKDSNGHVLQAGDSVVLIKDLNVKGASFIAKRGTAVRRISLVHDNPNHIEGKINGQHIVILTQYIKKT